MSNPKDLSGMCEAAVNLDAEGKTNAYEDISQANSSHSSTIGMEGGNAVIGEEIKSRNITIQIAKKHCQKRNETDDSKIVGIKRGEVYGCTGMSGGKAVNSTVIGEEVTSRNNTSHIADSVVKLRNETSGSEIVGMEGGESYESTIIGKKTVSEGNKQTVERSHIDVDVDPSAALQPLLIQSASGHDGDGRGGVSIKDTTIIITGTGVQSDDAVMNNIRSRGTGDLSRAATDVCSAAAGAGIAATAFAGVLAAPAVVGTATVGTLGYTYGKVKKLW